MEKPKFKTVQEVVAAGEEPERYLHTPVDDRAFNAPVPEMDIPVIDLSVILSDSEEGRVELSKLHSALSTWGVVQVMNHGISQALLEKIYDLTKKFFALPTEDKQKYARDIGSIQGYGNDMILSDDQVLDWIDRLFLTTYPENERVFKVWPEIPFGFRDTLHEYTMQQRLVIKKFFKGMARSLGLEDNCFLDMYGENGLMNARFNMYPPCPRPEKVIGIKPHGDGSAITLLLPDKDVEGLQFLKDGKWFKPVISSHTLLINLGDQMEIMSNGIYKSPVHRALTNKEKDRISIATFCIPDADNEVGPANGLVSEASPRRYKTFKKYVAIYYGYYQQGRRAIEAALI